MKNLLYAIITLHFGILVGYTAIHTFLNTDSFGMHIGCSMMFFVGLAICNFSRRVYKRGFDI